MAGIVRSLVHTELVSACKFGRVFHSAAVQFGFGSHSSDNDPDVLERNKQKNLARAKNAGRLGACLTLGACMNHFRKTAGDERRC